MKVALVIGHGPKIDQGAENRNGTTELKFNTGLVERIANELSINGSLSWEIVKRQIERVSPVKETNITQANFAIEFHCNSFDTKASGTEMIHYASSIRGKKLAQILQTEVVRVLQLPDRGVKEPWKGRGNTFLKKTVMAAVIAESFFIDNDKDLQRANDRFASLAKAYADACFKFASGLF